MATTDQGKERGGGGVPSSVGLCRVTKALNRENERQGGVSGAQPSGKEKFTKSRKGPQNTFAIIVDKNQGK